MPGGTESPFGGGPPYLRWPVVTSNEYPVLSKIDLILLSSGPLTTLKNNQNKLTYKYK